MIKSLFNRNKMVIWIFVAVLFFIMARIMENYPYLIEKYYSSSLNKWMIQGISHITGLVPFSIGELIVIGHIIAIPLIFIVAIIKYNLKQWITLLKKLISYVSIIYILFMFLWGFNYSRQSINEMMNLEDGEFSTEELYQVTRELIIKANDLRIEVNEDINGVMTIEDGYHSVFKRASVGYEIIAKDYSVLSGKYGRPKFILLSNPMLHTRIVGIYFPFTAEPNVNIGIPDSSLPSNTLHEMAHQRGFASEDEANFIAYLTATNHPDTDFQYSGTIMALTYMMNALIRDDAELASDLSELFSDGIKRDLAYNRQFWSQYEGKASDVAERINDSYLKGNGQEEGTKSYGAMVDLLLAYYRQYGHL